MLPPVEGAGMAEDPGGPGNAEAKGRRVHPCK